MWQPASLERLSAFFWSSGPFSLSEFLTRPTLSLAGLLGPVLLIPVAALLLHASGGVRAVAWFRRDRPVDRAHLFVMVWTAAVFVGVSALPAINYTFRVRYGIITMGPVCLLIAWALGVLVAHRRQLPRWGLAIASLSWRSRALSM